MFLSISASLAGPSEILVLADETANPRYIAADLLSQAEHDEMASAILITTNEEFADQVDEEVRGFVITIRSTPATFAGTIFISTEDGYTAFPPGT